MKPAGADVHIGDGVRADGIVVADSDALATGIFRATVFTEAGAEGVLGEAEQLPIGKATEQALLTVNGLINAAHVSICVAAGARGFRKIKVRSAQVRLRYELVQQIS